MILVKKIDETIMSLQFSPGFQSVQLTDGCILKPELVHVQVQIISDRDLVGRRVQKSLYVWTHLTQRFLHTSSNLSQ